MFASIRSVTERFSSWLGWLEKKSATFAGILVWVLTAIVTANVVGRYFFNRPLGWAFESAEYILVWFSFLAVAWILRNNRHIRVEVLTIRLPRRAQIILELFSHVICLVVFTVLTVFGVIVVLELYSRNIREISLLQAPSWPIYSGIVIGSALMLMEAVRQLFIDSRKLRGLGDSDGE